MSEVYVYDKAKYHYESIFEYGLPEEYAANHAVPILRWMVDNDLMSYEHPWSNEIAEFKKGKITIHELYFRFGNCLLSNISRNAVTASHSIISTLEKDPIFKIIEKHFRVLCQLSTISCIRMRITCN